MMEPRQAERRGYVVLFYATALTSFILDQGAKVAVRATIPEGATVLIVPGFFQLRHISNTGAAFGLFREAGPFLIAVAVIACWLFIRAGRKGFQRKRFAVAFGLMLGGALGNLSDRLLRGAVTDFFDFLIWPVFNVADICLSLGGLLALVWTVRGANGSDAIDRTAGG